MNRIKTAIFGGGFIGRVHLDALRRLESVELAALVDPNIDAARQLGTGFAIPTVVTDYREVMNDPEIDTVHVCTPNEHHFSIAKKALQAGKHVACEKPLATSRRG
jgi:predicted dehydrogenase